MGGITLHFNGLCLGLVNIDGFKLGHVAEHGLDRLHSTTRATSVKNTVCWNQQTFSNASWSDEPPCAQQTELDMQRQSKACGTYRHGFCKYNPGMGKGERERNPMGSYWTSAVWSRSGREVRSRQALHTHALTFVLWRHWTTENSVLRITWLRR
jgi:hypothetical protein